MAMTSSPFYVILALTALPLLLLSLPTQARPLTPAEIGQFDRFIRDVLRCARIPALSVSLVGDGEVVYEQGYGTANPASRLKTTKDTIFCLGSSTQAFTSVLLAALLSYNENRTFDTPLHDIIGSRVHLPGRFRTEFVTLKDVLAHRTGISNMDMVVTAFGMNRYRLTRDLRFAPEVSGFREENVFSEILFPLAEDAARALGGDTWYKLLRQYIFNPLGMDSVRFVHVDAAKEGRLATPVVSYNGKHTAVPMESFKGQEIIAAASSVCLSASDMSKWIHFVLSGGKNMNGEQVMSEEALQSTFKALQPRSNGDDTRSNGFSQPTIQVSFTRESNALGWIKGNYRGYPFVSQDGSLPGFESLATILPTRNIGVFTAFTGDGGARAYAAKTLINSFALDLLLQGQPWVQANEVCQVMDKMIDATMASEPGPKNTYVGGRGKEMRPLSEYEATYRLYGFGDVMVKRNDTDTLRLEYGEMGRYVLYPTARNDTFTMTALPGPLWYTTHADENMKKGPYLAIFKTRNNDPNGAIETVTIPHFARDMDPVFSRHPVVPRHYADEYEQQCDACAALAASVSVLVASVMAAVLGLVR